MADESEKRFASFDEFLAQADVGEGWEDIACEPLEIIAESFRPAVTEAIIGTARAMLSDMKSIVFFDNGTLIVRFIDDEYGGHTMGDVDLLAVIEEAVSHIDDKHRELAILERLYGLVVTAINARKKVR
jgi:hypothetical protein